MNKGNFPRVLVISMNAFSYGNTNNGKVLSQYFSEWDPDCLAQFFVANETPDFPVCRRYYRVTDKQAMRSFVTGKRYGETVTAVTESAAPDSAAGKGARSPLKRLIRDTVWNARRWWGKDFDRWIDDFAPEIVLVMVGGSSFIPNIALRIAKKRRLPLVIYNTESYYFDRPQKGDGLLYRLYRAESNRAFRKLMAYSSHEIYLNDALNQLYETAFGKRGTVIYQSTTVKPSPRPLNDPPIFSYAGNLGLKRHRSLIEIARALQSISSDYALDVYGGADDTTTNELNMEAGIRFHSRVPYEQVVRVIENSDFLLHTESFDPTVYEKLRTAFTAKIGDSLASGRCFVVYAPEPLACVEYLKRHDCACVITDPDTLHERLSQLINDEPLQQRYIQNALATASRNHNTVCNAETMREILYDEVMK